MNKTVISGDIVASTSLSDIGRAKVENALVALFEILQKDFGTYSRIIKGDYIECVLQAPEESLRVALIFKCMVKSLAEDIFSGDHAKRLKLFKTYGIKLAIGYGELSRFDPEKGIIDGEAIYLSGRKISELSTYKKERISIKSSLFFVSADDQLNSQFEPLFALLDVLINKATSRQCEVLYYKLMGLKEEEIVMKLGISQPVVNQHSSSAGWNAVDMAVTYFSNTIKKYNT